MATAENPAFAGGGPHEGAGSSAGIKAGLKDGTLTSDEAIILMEEQMEAREQRLRAELRDEIAAVRLGVADGGIAVASVVRGIVARLTETPTNFHQATVYFLATDAPEDEAMARRAPLLYATSLAMVGLQSVAVTGVFAGTFIQSCATSDQCATGTWCSLGGTGQCQFCGSAVPLSLEVDGACTFEQNGWGGELTAADATCITRNNAFDPNHVGFNRTRIAEVCTMPYVERIGLDGNGIETTYPDTAVASWCESCVRNDGTVDPLTDESLVFANIDAMGSFDHGTLVFVAFIVAFTVVGELKDIQLCSMTVANAGDKLPKGWRLAVNCLLGTRRWLFLPKLVTNVVTLVLYKGGDALSVCLTAVAILFLCDIDNIAFELALGERVRSRVEYAGRAELGDAQALALARTKVVHVPLIVLSLTIGLWLRSLWLSVLLPFITFLLGGVVESFVPGASAAHTVKRIGKVLGAWLLGFVAQYLLYLIAASLV